MQSVEPAVAPDAGLVEPAAEAAAEAAAGPGGAAGPTAGIGKESDLQVGRMRDRVLERLLVILNSAAILGVGADFKDLVGMCVSE